MVSIIERLRTFVQGRSNPLVYLSGADRAVLERCPSERTKMGALGGTVLMTGILAGCAATFAAKQWLHVSTEVAVIAGLLWSIMIMNLDRWLLASTRRQSSWWRTMILILPRVLLAFLLGAVIAEPLMLEIFKSEIATQIKTNRQNDQKQRQSDLEKQYANIQTMERAADALEDELAAPDDSVLTRSADFKSLQTRFNALTRQAAKARHRAQCEYDGVCGTGKKGDGPSFQAKQTEAAQLGQRASQAEQQMNQLRRQLLAKSATAKKTADVATNEQLREKRQDIATQRKNFLEDSKIARANYATDKDFGLADRVEAFSQVKETRGSVENVALLIQLFILMVDCAPVLFKALLLLGTPSLYEVTQDLFEKDEKARQEADEDLRKRVRKQKGRVVLKDAEVQRQFQEAALEDLTKEVVDVQKEAAQAYIENWREQVMAQVEAMKNQPPPASPPPPGSPPPSRPTPGSPPPSRPVSGSPPPPSRPAPGPPPPSRPARPTVPAPGGPPTASSVPPSDAGLPDRLSGRVSSPGEVPYDHDQDDDPIGSGVR